MVQTLLPSVTLVLALASSLTWRPAPPWAGVWKLAIALGEFGHALVWVPLGLAGLSWQLLAGWPRGLALVCCAISAAALLRPIVMAHRIARRLPHGLRAAFGEAAAGPGAPLSWRRLFWPPRLARGPVSTENFGTPESGDLWLDFFRGHGDGASPRPCLVVVHGGGWDGGERSQLSDWNHRWAARGYAVAAISYRLAPRHRWPAQRDDVSAAVAWLKKHAARLGLDPTRLVLCGRSAGGQIATAVAYGANDPAIRGVISFYAPQDMAFAWSVSREDDTLNSINLMRQYLGGGPDTPALRAVYESASAQQMVSPTVPPTLLIHGQPDTLVWVRHSERMAARLREAGVPHYFLSLPWATHGFDFNAHGPGGQLADFAIDSFLRSATALR